MTKDELRAQAETLTAAWLARNAVTRPSPEQEERAEKARRDLAKGERHAHRDGQSYGRHQNEAYGTPGGDARDAREHDLRGKPGHSLLVPKG